MEIGPHDILVIPDHLEIPGDFPHQFHKMKYLHTPSIVSSLRGPMNTPQAGFKTGTFILNLLGMGDKKHKPGKDMFFRHIRILNKRTNEYFHNRGATLLIDLRADEGRFFFSYAICNHLDRFNKLIAYNVCEERMETGDNLEIINYDPSISVLQNIYIALGVHQGEYSLTDWDWEGILPELYSKVTEEQEPSLASLRRLIRDKA